MSKTPMIGIALGSGGARGWCHIGVLRGLEQIGVRPDVVAGTSMGALVGAAWAGGRLDALEDWVRALTPARFMRMMDVRLRTGGLVQAREIEVMLEEIGLSDRIENLALPFTAVATDLATGREIWLNEGPTYSAVRASAGIPGVMCPIVRDGRYLLDGVLTNPVPVSAARAMGAEVIIAVNPSANPHGRIWAPHAAKPAHGWLEHSWLEKVMPNALREAIEPDAAGNAGGDSSTAPPANPGVQAPNYFEVLYASIDVMTETIRRSRMAGEPPHIALDAELTDLPVLELYRGAQAIAEGERIVAAQADRIRAVCFDEW